MNEVYIKLMRAMRAQNFWRPRPLLAMNRRRNLRKCGNLRSSSKFAIAIVLTKQTMGVTVIIRVIIPGSKVTVQEKVGRLKPPQPPRFLRPCISVWFFLEKKILVTH